jgi:hypothetical protein
MWSIAPDEEREKHADLKPYIIYADLFVFISVDSKWFLLTYTTSVDNIMILIFNPSTYPIITNKGQTCK